MNNKNISEQEKIIRMKEMLLQLFDSKTIKTKTMKKEKNISEHISYKEATFSKTAKRYGIDNIPTKEQLGYLRLLADILFEPLREWVDGPVKINSMFRSEKLNRFIGGARNSQHLANNGAAVDIDDTFDYKTNAEMFHYIKDNLDYDQLIAENVRDGKVSWVHVSYNKGKNRGQALIYINGRYLNWDDYHFLMD